MGVAVNGAHCKKCENDFGIILEWRSREGAIKVLDEAKCYKCGSQDFYLTDEMGQ